MTNHLIFTNLFYILSGPSASGKSSLTKQLIEQGLPLDSIVSTDSIRKQILGSSFSTDENGMKETLHGWSINQPEIFSIIDDILSIRLKQKLPTFFDATNLDDTSRKKYVDLAAKYGTNSHVIIFDVEKEELKRRLMYRQERFDFSVVEKQLEKFSLTSQFPFTIVHPNDTFTLLPELLSTTKIDVVSDTHGLLEETILLLKQRQWHYKDLCFYHDDPERKLLFLGDAVDRGTQSIELLKTIMNSVNNGSAYFILGNHEAKLISSYEQYKNDHILRGKSLSSAQTLLKFVALPLEEQENIYQFLIQTPVHYCLWVDKTTSLPTLNEDNSFKISFAHADNNFYDPYRFTRSHALYGSRTLHANNDSDELYEKNYNSGLNKYIYVRGHIPNSSLQNHIYSLEDNQAFAGNVVALDLEKYINVVKNNQWESTHQLFEDNIVKQKSEFNFNDEIRSSVDLMKKMNELVKNGLATDGWRKDDTGQKIANPDGLKVYKYSKKVHFKRLWQTEPLLAKARGLVIDIAGNIVVHPFDKLYNYGEYDTGNDVTVDRKVQMIEKLNGFLGCISKHPFREELLVSTTGSLNSPFVQYINDFIDDKTKYNLLQYFKNNKKTLMFEVIHPDDQHIIEYDKKDHGLWLIGARGLNINDAILTEKEVDNIAQTLDIKRALWKEATFKEVLDQLPHSTLEGYMVRDAVTHEPLMKIKTNYYLVTKFIGRMGGNMTTHMYKHPEKFKEDKVEEEFYPIVDEIVSTITQADFEKMEPKARVDFVRNIINKQRNNITTQAASIKLK